jgi:imidazoleglycerol-phosphate dehydratase
MSNRQTSITRETAETKIKLELELDQSGFSEIQTGIGFLDHMLTLLAFHAQVQLRLSCLGDLKVDAHHTTEDIGLALGQALRTALANGQGIRRYGQSLLPMDEALVMVSFDISGRAGCYCTLNIPSPRLGDFDTELVEEFFQALCRGGGFTLHLQQMAGRNSHHLCEACFKGFGRALGEAITVTDNSSRIPSSKGVLL